MAQLSSFSWSDSVAKNEGEISKILSFDKFSVVIFQPKTTSIRLDMFNGNKQSTDIIEFKGRFVDVCKVSNSVVIFSVLFNDVTKKDELLAKVIREGNVKELTVLGQEITGTLHSKFEVSVSPDFRKVVILIEDPYKKGKKETVAFSVLNEDLVVERSTNFLMSGILSHKRKINVPLINNNGDVYVVKRYREERRESKYYVLAYASNGNINFNELKLNYKPIKDVQFLLNEDGELIIGGTYSSPNSIRSEGVYITKYNSEGVKLYRKEYGFRPETMLAFTSTKALRKEGLGLYGFRTNKLIQQKGNIVLILEHRVIEANSKTATKTEKRDGLIVYSFDLVGNFVWDRTLEMYQTDESEKGYWNSFMCFNDTANNNLSIIYNEVGYTDKKADNVFGDRTAVGARNIVIDNQGNYKKTAVKNSFKGAGIDLVLSPRVTSQVGSKMLMIAEPLDKHVYFLGKVE